VAFSYDGLIRIGIATNQASCYARMVYCLPSLDIIVLEEEVEVFEQ